MRRETLRHYSADQIRALVRNASRAAEPELVRHAGSSRYPLSFEQERLWFHQQLFPDSVAYNWPAAIEICADLSATTWQRVLECLASRHEILRTAYDVVDGEPVQVIDATATIVLHQDDVSSVEGEEERLRAVRRIVGRHAARPFDLRVPPLFRCGLIRLASAHHVAWFVFHHSVTDGWTAAVMASEVQSIVRALESETLSMLPPLPVQYGDFSIWQRHRFSGARAERLRRFWRESLVGMAVLDWPADARRTSESERGATEWFEIPPELAARVQAFVRAEGVSLFTLMFAAFIIVLHRYTGADDIPVAVPVSGRVDHKLEPLIGFFVNTIIIRGDVSGDPTFRDCLQRARRACQDALQHQEMPYGEVVRELNPERELGRNPLARIGFQVEDRPVIGRDRSGTAGTTRPLEIDAPAVFYDFDLHLTATHGTAAGLRGMITYSPEVARAETIRGFVRHYVSLLDHAISAPETAVARLPLLSATERDELRAMSVARAATRPAAVSVVSALQQQIRVRPTATAIVDRSHRLTYADVAAAVGHLVSTLRQRGIGSGDVVALESRNSAALVVAMMGVLASGAAYVVLDPDLPDARRAFVTRDSGAKLVLTAEELTEIPWLRFVGGGTGAVPWATVRADDVAYLIYTSGSTGEPKGVVVTHDNLAHYTSAISTRLAMEAGTRYGLITSLAADLSYTTLFPALCSGGTLFVCDPATLDDADVFEEWMDAHRIDCIKITPSLLRALTSGRSPWRAIPSRCVVLGGEALPADFARQLRVWKPGCRIVNHYGPTECTVGVATCDADEAIATSSGSVPIGHPLGSAALYVLDRHLEHVPIGVVGELYIGGPCTARGYTRLDLTAARFVTDPFSASPDGRLFRTGDLVRRLIDGSLEFIGRNDDQVKIRGYRVEVGEVEAAICRLEAIREAAVTIAPDTSGSLQITAHLVPASPTFNLAEARRTLGASLPSYMVPAFWNVLDELPRTNSGKIARTMLSRAPRVGPPATLGQPPRDALEQELAELWHALLGTTAVGIDDNFFELGGHSLLAIKLMTEVRKRHARAVSGSVFYRNPTIRGLAGALRQQQTVSTEGVVSLRSGDARQPLFLIHPAGGDALCYVPLARSLAFDGAVYGLTDDVDRDTDSIEAMAERYLQRIQALQPAGPYRIGGWSIGALVAFEIATRLARRGEVVAFLGVLDFALDARTADHIGPSGGLDATWLATVANRLAQFAHRPAALRPDDFVSPDDAGSPIAAFAREMRVLGLVPDDAAEEFWTRFIETYRRNVNAANDYVPGRYRGALSLFRSADDGHDGATVRSRDLGWQRWCQQPVTIHDVPGTHMTMMTVPCVDHLAVEMSGALCASHGAMP